MEPLLKINNLSIEYNNINNKKQAKTLAVNNVSLKIYPGEIYALAGESGCGKTSLAKSIVKLNKPSCGEIFFEERNIFEQNRKEKKDYTKKVQMVFQNPYSSLNPRMKIKDIIREPLDINTSYSKKEKEEIILDLLKDTGLKENCLDLYPHEFSGGQRQRIAITRALVLNPSLLIADEPVSALDASIQAQILNIFKELKNKRNLTILFISHDMNVIRYLADRVGVMKYGKLVEENYTNTLFKHPQEEYTKMLLKSVPTLIV